ncbi:MAG: hypothetical protein CMG57_07600 [Candidatus Marinimicrobia bacterium]|nr:hypothetical protein [Candidatus Neomarinimicrobiota bacterium]
MSYKIWENLEQVEKYANRRYRSWDQRLISNREKSIVQSMLQENNLDGPILDCPSGFGRFHDVLTTIGKVYAADINHFAVKYYNKYISHDPEAVEARAENLPFQDSQFQGVFSFRLLQHIHTPEDRMTILKEFSRVASSWVIASFYISSPIHIIHRKIIKMPSKITMISVNDLYKEASAVGLKVVTNKAVIPGLHANRIVLMTHSK